MNKTKVILASIGGVALVAALVLGYFIWDAFSEKGDVVEELDAMVSAADRLTALPVYPGPEGVKAYDENHQTFENWREEATKVVSSGDRKFEPTTAPAFKTFLVEEARRLSDLPGGVEGKLVKPDFPFGFKDYITGGVLPAVADLPRLQREWADVSTVVAALAECGVLEIVDVTVKAPAPAADQSAQQGRRPRQQAKGSQKKDEEAEAAKPDVTTFTVDFVTRPAGLVAAVNAFVTDQRFIVVDTFSFARVKDELAEAIDDSKKAAEAPARGGRGRGRGRRQAAEAQQQEEEKEGERKSTLVTDPLKASPLKVSMAFSVYDFKSPAGQPEATEKTEEVK